MRYVIGAAVGAVLALLLGMPALISDSDTQSEPPLYSTYCDLSRMAEEWEDACIPSSGGIAFMMAAGAAVGALASAVLRRLKTEEDATDGAGPNARSPADTATADRRRQERDKTRDEVLSEAAQQISAAIERRRDLTVHQAIQRKTAGEYISTEVRDRAAGLAIVNLSGTAVERAVEMGWLRSEGSGPDQLLSRTSQPLPVAGDSSEGKPVADVIESTEPGPVEAPEDAQAGRDQVSTAKRTQPDPLEEFENLIRLHERGVLTDAELEAAKSRLLSRDDE